MKKKNLCSKINIKDIEKIIIKIGLNIAKKGEGALFIISDKINYKRLLKQKVIPFSILDCGAEKMLSSLATIDGAVIINRNGIVVDCGAKVNSKKVLKGFGTRHAAAYSASFEKSTISILVSQEEKKIKIFSKGKVIAQIDVLEKGIEKHIDNMHDVLESVGVGAVSALGIGAIAPEIGLAILPGILLFGVPYFVFKRIKENSINFR